MRFRCFLLLALLATTLRAAAQTHFDAGIVYGDGGAFSIPAPKGWVLDNESGLSQGVPCVLYLAASDWQNSPVVMYAKVQGEPYPTIDSFVAFARRDYLATDPGFRQQFVKTIRTTGGLRCDVYDNYISEFGSYERVAYVQLPKGVGLIVFSARNQADFRTYADAIYEVVGGLLNMPEFKPGDR